MGTVTFRHLDEIPDGHLERMIVLLMQDGKICEATAPRAAQIYASLEAVLHAEQRRRAQRELPHSAVAISVALPAAEELSASEMRSLMRRMLECRTAFAGGTPAVSHFFDVVLTALRAEQAEQHEFLRRLDGELEQHGEVR